MKINLNRPDGVDFSGAEWMALERWIEMELGETYKRLSGLNTSDTEVRQLQGRASVLHQMLGFRTQTAGFRPPQ